MFLSNIFKTTALALLLAVAGNAQGLLMQGVTSRSGPGFSGYLHQRQITIASTETTATQANFPQLVCANMTLPTGATCPTATDLAVIGSGGAINNTTTFPTSGQTVPADMVFTSDSTCTTLLTWDFASYVTTTGAFEARVAISSLSSSSNTVFYMCYGKASITTYQGGSKGAAYDANTCAVYHFGTSSLSLQDSSSNGADITNHGTTGGTGMWSEGIVSAGAGATSNATATTGCTLNGNPLTIIAWVLNTANGVASAAELGVGGSSSNFDIGPRNTSVTANWQCVGLGLTVQASGASNTWTQFACTTSSGGSTGTITSYRNGASIATGSYSTAYSGGSGITFFTFPGASLNSQITGTMDEVEISNTNRPTSWIAAEYAMQSAPSTYITIAAEL